MPQHMVVHTYISYIYICKRAFFCMIDMLAPIKFVRSPKCPKHEHKHVEVSIFRSISDGKGRAVYLN